MFGRVTLVTNTDQALAWDCVAAGDSPATDDSSKPGDPARETRDLAPLRSPDFDSVSSSGGKEGKTLRICGVAGKCQSEKVVFWFAVNSSFFVSHNLMAFQIHDLHPFFLGLFVKEKHGDSVTGDMHDYRREAFISGVYHKTTNDFPSGRDGVENRRRNPTHQVNVAVIRGLGLTELDRVIRGWVGRGADACVARRRQIAQGIVVF